jgi:SAM-dependent methyltransferase
MWHNPGYGTMCEGMERRFMERMALEQRFSFNEIAALYDAARPGYPDALFGDVIAAAELAPDDSILEIGCGTGQATRAFARRGLRLLAIDPGAETIRVARQSLAEFQDVEFAEATFEAWPAQRAAFRLIVAAQSWHWVAPAIGFAKAADVLVPGGTLAVFAHVPVGLDPALLEEFRRIYPRYAGFELGLPPERDYLPLGMISRQFADQQHFSAATHKGYAWTWAHTTASYTDFLRTRSDLRMLEPARREALLAAIADAVAAQGGKFEMSYETHLYMARRSP